MTGTLPEDGIVDPVAVDAALRELRAVNLTPFEQLIVDLLRALRAKDVALR
jgi:hypothetical protein